MYPGERGTRARLASSCWKRAAIEISRLCRYLTGVVLGIAGLLLPAKVAEQVTVARSNVLACPRSVSQRISLDLAATFGAGLPIGVNAGLIRVQAATTGPTSQPIHGLRRRHSHRHDVLCGLSQRHIQQRRQAAATTDLRAGPILGVRLGLVGVEVEQVQADVPDGCLLCCARQIKEEDAIEPLGPRKLGCSLEMSLHVQTTKTSD